MRNGFNQFSVPYMNELTANQFGAGSVFGGNTPTSFINYSLDTIAAFYQGQSAPQTGRPEDFEPVIINGRRVLRRKQTQLDQILKLPGSGPGGTPPINPQQSGSKGKNILDLILGREGTGPIIGSDEPMVSDGKGTIGDDPTGSGKKAEALFGTSGFTTRIVIIVLGLILVLAAIVSLR